MVKYQNNLKDFTIKNTIHSFWFSKNIEKNAISEMEVLCIASYLSCNHSFTLYTYTPQDTSMLYLTERLQFHKFFSKFSIKDANEIVPQDKLFFDDRGEVGIAAFSDYIRYHILYKEGGWWVDTDTICVQSLESLDMPFVFASEREEDGSIIPTTCVIKAPKDSPILLKIIQEMDKIISNKKNRAGRLKLKNILRLNFSTKVKWGIIGPLFLGDFIVRHKLENYVVDAKYFCDISWFETKNFITPHTKIAINKDIYIYIIFGMLCGQIYNLIKMQNILIVFGNILRKNI